MINSELKKGKYGCNIKRK